MVFIDMIEQGAHLLAALFIDGVMHIQQACRLAIHDGPEGLVGVGIQQRQAVVGRRMLGVDLDGLLVQVDGLFIVLLLLGYSALFHIQ